MSPGSPHTRHGIFILFRHLRLPLVVLILVYAVVVLGFTLVPGVDPAGQPWRMSFLHAFYFVSFLGTTIGLGEIPHPFSDAQRLWATGAIYATVTAWLYAVGATFGVLRDATFRRVVREERFERAVRRLRKPFYLLCGYGDSGQRVAHELAEDGVGLVVIDIEEDRVDEVDLNNLQVTAPALVADACDPMSLQRAGLSHPLCTGVLALTGSDATNTAISLSARMLSPALPVLCAARNHAWHARMAASGADHIINPYDTFAQRVALSIRVPSLHVIYEALTAQVRTPMDEPQHIPRGHWILCGSDLFVHALQRELGMMRIECTVIDGSAGAVADKAGYIAGDPTDPAVLRGAGAEKAAVLVAGTAIETDNLTITLAARAINKHLFIVARQVQRRNSMVFRASPADLVTVSSYVLSAEVLRHIRTPLLSRFLSRSLEQGEAWAGDVLQRLRILIGDEILESWSIRIAPAVAPTVCRVLQGGETVTLERLMTRTDGTGKKVRALPLLLQRGREPTLLPPLDMPLTVDDEVLFCGSDRARSTMRHTIMARSLAVVAGDAAP